MAKTVKLTVHKNTKAQRNSRRLRKDILTQAKEVAQLRDINQYVIIGFSDKDVATAWESKDGDELVLPEKAKMALARTIHNYNYEN